MELLQVVFKYCNIILAVLLLIVFTLLLVKTLKMSKSLQVTSSKVEKINNELNNMQNKIDSLNDKASKRLPELVSTYGALELVIAILKDHKRSKKQKASLLSSIVRVSMQNPSGVIEAANIIKKM